MKSFEECLNQFCSLNNLYCLMQTEVKIVEATKKKNQFEKVFERLDLLKKDL